MCFCCVHRCFLLLMLLLLMFVGLSYLHLNAAPMSVRLYPPEDYSRDYVQSTAKPSVQPRQQRDPYNIHGGNNLYVSQVSERNSQNWML